jgi:dihydrolipoamide dehydrogenase
MRNFGVEVTIVEFLDRVLPNEDSDVSKEIARAYKKLGITVHTSTAVQGIDDDGAKVTVTLEDLTRHETRTITIDSVLQAIGFAPRVQGYGLEHTGVELTDGGAIAISDVMRTNVSHIYAIGDVTAKLQLAHVAEAQALVAAETIAGVPTLPIEDYRTMPRATFCQPQVASFGLTEAQAEAEGHAIKVATFPFTANGKAHGLGDPTGFVKLICDTEYGLLLGGHLVGHDASELLPELTLAQKWDLTIHELARNVHTHPTLSEAVQEAIHGLMGEMINL